MSIAYEVCRYQRKNAPGWGRACAKALRWEPVPCWFGLRLCPGFDEL